MQFLGYLLMGGFLYMLGTVIFLKKIKPKKANQDRLAYHDKRLLPYLACCLLLMLVLSSLISLYLLNHKTLDITYVLVNSVVGVVVFYFGLNPDEMNMKLPD